MTVGLSAGGSQLSVRKGPSAVYYLEIVSVTAVTDDVVDNPTSRAPDTARV